MKIWIHSTASLVDARLRQYAAAQAVSAMNRADELLVSDTPSAINIEVVNTARRYPLLMVFGAGELARIAQTPPEKYIRLQWADVQHLSLLEMCDLAIFILDGTPNEREWTLRNFKLAEQAGKAAQLVELHNFRPEVTRQANTDRLALPRM